jgi:hypothetical protein
MQSSSPRSGGPTPIVTSSSGCAWAWGGIRSPAVLRRQAPFGRLWIVGFCHHPSADARGQVPADNGQRWLDPPRASSSGGVHAAQVGGLRARYHALRPTTLGNSVGAIESVARRRRSYGASGTRGWAAIRRGPTCTVTLTSATLRGGDRSLRRRFRIVTWLILPVVICLSQRLSHACLSISNYTVKLRMAH